MSSTKTAPSQVTTSIDFDRDGLQTGVLQVPYSHDRDAYGYIPVPIAVARNGEGPTMLLTGANHGDEYEGSVAIMHLMRELDVSALRGRVIMVPALNFPAYLNGTRTSPVDRGNLNRLFPGDPNGTPTQMIAHYVGSVLVPMADWLLDFHAGGTTMDYLPTLFVNTPADAESERRCEMVIEAFGAPRVMYMGALEGETMIGSSARRNGVYFATGEFGGKGSVGAEGVRIVSRGIRALLCALEMMPRSFAPTDRPAPSLRLGFTAAHYVFSPVPGIFEPRFELGDAVRAGDLAGLVHDPYRPWAQPEAVHFRADGIAIMKRTLARVDAGTCLGHLAFERT